MTPKLLTCSCLLAAMIASAQAADTVLPSGTLTGTQVFGPANTTSTEVGATTTVAGTADITVKAGRLVINPGFHVVLGGEFRMEMAPYIITPPSVTPQPVIGTTAQVALTATYVSGESALTYTWSKFSGPGTVGFSPNGTNAAKTATATFSAAGSYVLECVIAATGTSVTWQVAATVSPTPTTVTVTPANGAMYLTSTKTFAVTAHDQFGALITPTPPVDTWEDSPERGDFAGPVFTATSVGTTTITATIDGAAGGTGLTVHARPLVAFDGSTSSTAEATASYDAQVSLDAAAIEAVSVPFTVSGTAGSADHGLVAGSVQFAIGQITRPIAIPHLDDALDEHDETVIVTLGTPSLALPGTVAVHTHTITDDDQLPAVAMAVSTSQVGETPATALVSVTLSEVSGRDVTVGIAQSGTVASGTDITAVATSLVIPAGQTSADIEVAILADSLDEADETVALTLQAPTHATLGAATHTLTITDDDQPPVMAMAASAATVGEASGTTLVSVTLAAVSGREVSVGITRTGTASSGSDHTAVATSLVIPAGQASGTIAVAVTDDSLDEDDETVVLTLHDPVNATLGAISHTLTIADDDQPPVVAMAASASQAGEGSGSALVSVTLSTASGRAVSVPIARSGTASSGSDYTFTSPLVISAGAVSAAITVAIIDDSYDESDETVVLTLEASQQATLGSTASHTVTILDDAGDLDPQPPAVSFPASGSTVAESLSPAPLTVQLLSPVAVQVSVPYSVTGGTAGSGIDFALASGVLVFAPGETTALVPLSLLDDTLVELDETVQVTLGTPTGAPLGAIPVHTLTITDPDRPRVAFSAGASSVSEGSGSMQVLVELDQPSPRAVSVAYALAGTAIRGDAPGTGIDYVLIPAPVTFAIGVTSALIDLDVVDDATLGDDLTVSLILSDPVEAILGVRPDHLLTIVDDDGELATPGSPVFSPGPGVSVASRHITITAVPAHAEVWYTSGTAPADPVPGAVGSTRLTAPLLVSATTTIKAVCALPDPAGGWLVGPVVPASYVVLPSGSFGAGVAASSADYSPVCVEGTGPLEGMTVTAKVMVGGWQFGTAPVKVVGAGSFYADAPVHVSQSSDVVFTVSDQHGGSTTVTRTITPTAVDMTGDGEEIVIREGDSLRMTVNDYGSATFQLDPGNVGEGRLPLEALTGTVIDVPYPVYGTYQAIACQNGAEVGRRSIVVLRAQVDADEIVAAEIEYARDYSVEILPNALDVIPTSIDNLELVVDKNEATSTDTRLDLTLQPMRPGTPMLLLRIGEAGPILAAKEVDEFKLRPFEEFVVVPLTRESNSWTVRLAMHPYIGDGITDQLNQPRFAASRIESASTSLVGVSNIPGTLAMDGASWSQHSTAGWPLRQQTASGAYVQISANSTTQPVYQVDIQANNVGQPDGQGSAKLHPTQDYDLDGKIDYTPASIEVEASVVPPIVDDLALARLIARLDITKSAYGNFTCRRPCAHGPVTAFDPTDFTISPPGPTWLFTSTPILPWEEFGGDDVDYTYNLRFDSTVVVSSLAKVYYDPEEQNIDKLTVSHVGGASATVGEDGDFTASLSALADSSGKAYFLVTGQRVTTRDQQGEPEGFATINDPNAPVQIDGIETGLNPHPLPLVLHVGAHDVNCNRHGYSISIEVTGERSGVTFNSLSATGQLSSITSATGISPNWTLTRSHARVNFYDNSSFSGTPLFSGNNLTATVAKAYGQGSDFYTATKNIYPKFLKDDEVVLTVGSAPDQKKSFFQAKSGLGAATAMAPVVPVGDNGSINVHRGNLHLSFPVKIPSTVAAGPGLVLSYNSLDGLNNGLGSGWRTNWDMRIIDNTLIDETGRRGRGAADPAITISQMRDEDGVLTGYKALRQDNRVLFFDEHGWLIRIETIAGEVTTIARDADHVATLVTDVTYGGELDLVQVIQNGTHSAPLAALSVAESGTWSFTYNTENANTYLSEATLSGGTHALAGAHPPTGAFHNLDEAGAIVSQYTYLEDGKGRFYAAGAQLSPDFDSEVSYVFNSDNVPSVTQATAIDVLGGVTVFNNPSSGFAPSMTDPRGLVLTRSFTNTLLDGLHIVEYVGTAPGTQRKTMRFEPITNRLTESTEQLDASQRRITRFRWTDLRDQNPDLEGANLLAEQREENVAGLLDAVDGSDLVTTHEYHAHGRLAGRLKSSVDPTGLTAGQQYTTDGFPLISTDAKHKEWLVAAFDTVAIDQPALIVSPAGRTTAHTYDAMGRIASTTDDLGYTTTFERDAKGRVIKTILPGESGQPAPFTETWYDPLGRVTASRDQLGRVSETTYDRLGRVVKVEVAAVASETTPGEAVAPEGAEIADETFEYAVDGSLMTHRRGTTVLGKNGFDDAGRQVTSTVPRTLVGGSALATDCTSATTYSTVTGFVQSTSDARSTVLDPILTTYTHDLAGRVLSVTSPEGVVTSSTYNSQGWVLTSTDGSGFVTRYAYDRLGRQLRTTNPAGGWSTTTYDETGNPTFSQQSAGAGVATLFDEDGVAIGSKDRFGSVTHSVLEKVGGTVRSRVWREDTSATITQAYDLRALPADLTTALPTGSFTTAITRRDDGSLKTLQATGRGQQGTAIDGLGRTRATFRTAEIGGVNTELRETVEFEPTFGHIERRTDALGLRNEPIVAATGEINGTGDNAVGAVVEPTHQVLERDAEGRVIKSGRHTGTGGPILETTYEYDGDGRLTTRTDPGGVVTVNDYDAGGRLLSVSRAGKVTTYEHDALGNVVLTTDPTGKTRGASYDTIGRMLSSTVGGEATAYRYDETTLALVEVVAPGQRSTTYEHDARGRVAAIVDPAEQRREMAYDDLDRVIATMDADGAVSTYRYAADRNELESSKDRAGRIATYTYDPSGRQKTRTVPGSSGPSTTTRTVVSMGGVGGGSVEQVTHGGSTIERHLDRAGRLVKLKLPGVPDLDITYDRAGRMVTKGDTSYTYDANGRLATITQTGVGAAALAYNSRGLLASLTLPNDVVRTYIHDDAGRLDMLTQSMLLNGQPNPVGESWQLYRDDQGRISSMVASGLGFGHAVAYRYRDGRMVREQRTNDESPDGNETALYAYDAVDNRTARALYRVPASQNENFTTTPPALPATVQAVDGTWTVDAEARLAVAGGTSPARATLVLTTGTNQLGPDLSLVVGAASPAGTVLYAVRIDNADGTHYRAGWQVRPNIIPPPEGQPNPPPALADGRVVIQHVTAGDVASELASSPWIRDHTGLRTMILTHMPDAVLEVAAIAPGGTAYELAEAVCPGIGMMPSATTRSLVVIPGSGATAAGTFDALAWTTCPSRLGESQVVNSFNQVIQRTQAGDGTDTTAATTAFTYDLAGRCTVATTSVTGQPDQVTTSSYDELDRLTEVIVVGGATAVYGYYADTWMRATASEGGTTATFAWDGQNNRIAQTIGGVTTRYAHHGAKPLWETTGGSHLHYGYDALGNVTGHFGVISAPDSANGMPPYVRRFRYDSFGNVSERTVQYSSGGASGNTPAAVTPGAKYRGMWFDGPGTGLYKTQTRSYDPAAGRFTQVDPARAGQNWYGYCEGEPVNNWDPTGLETWIMYREPNGDIGDYGHMFMVVQNDDTGEMRIADFYPDKQEATLQGDTAQYQLSNLHVSRSFWESNINYSRKIDGPFGMMDFKKIEIKTSSRYEQALIDRIDSLPNYEFDKNQFNCVLFVKSLLDDVKASTGAEEVKFSSIGSAGFANRLDFVRDAASGVMQMNASTSQNIDYDFMKSLDIKTIDRNNSIELINPILTASIQRTIPFLPGQADLPNLLNRRKTPYQGSYHQDNPQEAWGPSVWERPSRGMAEAWIGELQSEMDNARSKSTGEAGVGREFIHKYQQKTDGGTTTSIPLVGRKWLDGRWVYE